MGALKGQFQCLQGLCIPIDSKSEHYKACCWVTIAIILHNLIIDVKDPLSAEEFAAAHTLVEEEEDTGLHPGNLAVFTDGEEKQEMLIEMLMEWRRLRDGHQNDD
jgi:hypothetical protein